MSLQHEVDSKRPPHPTVVREVRKNIDALADALPDYGQPTIVASGTSALSMGASVSRHVGLVAPAQPLPDSIKFFNRMMDEFIFPSVRLRSEADVVAFWNQHLHRFSVALSAYDYAVEMDLKTPLAEQFPSAADSADMFGGIAFALDGTELETIVRWALVDACRARRVVASFKDLPPATDQQQYRELAARHNRGALVLNIGLLSLAGAAWGKVELPEDVLVLFGGFVGEGANVALHCARHGLLLRGGEEMQDLTVLAAGWPRPCESAFRYVACNAPAQLTKFFWDSQLSAGLRARAVDAAAEIDDPDLLRRLLLPLLRDASVPPVMQESCIYALDDALDAEVTTELRRLSSDITVSEGVRDAALEALATK